MQKLQSDWPVEKVAVVQTFHGGFCIAGIFEPEEPLSCHVTSIVQHQYDGLLHRLEVSEELHDVFIGHNGTQPEHLDSLKF